MDKKDCNRHYNRIAADKTEIIIDQPQKYI